MFFKACNNHIFFKISCTIRTVRRLVFLLLILGLLLCAQYITILATHASPKQLPQSLKVASLQFYYKLDENARFLDLKTQWQTEHRGALSLQKAAEFAEIATKQASVEAELLHWRAQGGPSPKIFTAKLHLFNPGCKAILDIPLTITVKANVGELRVSPTTQLTDYGHLRRTAHWETISTHTLHIPVIAPEEDQLLEVAQFRLLEFMGTHSAQWPEAVRVTVSSPQLGIVEKQLSVLPDHFVISTLY